MSQQHPVFLYLKCEVKDPLCGTLLTKGRGMTYQPFGHDEEYWSSYFSLASSLVAGGLSWSSTKCRCNFEVGEKGKTWKIVGTSEIVRISTRNALFKLLQSCNMSPIFKNMMYFLLFIICTGLLKRKPSEVCLWVKTVSARNNSKALAPVPH